jgi:NCAIR mutase (PurE)-related protein
MINDMLQPDTNDNASDSCTDACASFCLKPGYICGRGKTAQELRKLLFDVRAEYASAVVTAVKEECGTVLVSAFPEGEYDPLAEVFIIRPQENRKEKVIIVTAGKDDIPAALEAKYALSASGIQSSLIQTGGTADLGSLIGLKERLSSAAACIAVAGVDSSLPGIVAGATQMPVIALPVSKGKKNEFGGWLSLLGTLGSESTGLVVVGVDNGAGAGFAAARIINSSSGRKSTEQ